MRKSYILTNLIVITATLGIITSLLALWYACLSTYAVTLHNPRLRTYNSFEVSNESVSLRGYGYGLEFSEGLSSDAEADINRRMGFRVDYIFSYVFRDTSCGILSLHTSTLERMPLIPYNIINIYEAIYLREISINIEDFSRLISKSCINDRSGWLHINILLRHSYLITDLKYPEVEAIALQHVWPYHIMHLKIPVDDDGTALRFVYDNVTYLVSSPFTGECKVCGVEKRCTWEVCTYAFLLTEAESSDTIREVNLKPRTTLENERVLMLLFIPITVLLIITSSLLIYHYLKGIS
ncbi:MAG: hypothetical protein QXD94_06040 [Sulfolobales archaeon]